MKGLWTLIVVTLFLIGFISAVGITGSAVNNDSDNSEDNGSNPTITSAPSEDNESPVNETPRPSEEQSVGRPPTTMNNGRDLRHPRLTEEQIKKIIHTENRIDKIEAGKCPQKCNCTNSSISCSLHNETREITINREEGRVIVQVNGENMTTNLTFYRGDDGKLYAVNKNNETREVKMLPDQVKEKMREKLQRDLGKENITLDENGTYQYEGEKNVTFLFFHFKQKIRAEINSETGEVQPIKNPWWVFLVRDEGQNLVGASCGTVTPGYNDKCCQTKNYDFWNQTAAECQFNSTVSS
jgi:hypothetical protein